MLTDNENGEKLAIVGHVPLLSLRQPPSSGEDNYGTHVSLLAILTANFDMSMRKAIP